MSFNHSFSVGYLLQTNIYNQNGADNNSSRPNTINVSGNIEVTLYPRWYKNITVEWNIPADWGNCVFNVYFSQSSDGPFTRLNPSPVTGTYLKDSETQEYSKNNRVYYLVEAILLDRGNVSIKSQPTTWDTVQNPWVELRANEIQRREWLLLNKFTGTRSFLYRRKNYGERCPDCWSYKLQKVMKDKCEVCYGTSFKYGYFQPYETYIQYDASPNSNQKTYFGKWEPNNIAAWTISYPEIQPDDLIVRSGEWDLFRVENVSKTELQSRRVRQILQMVELPKSVVEYELLSKIQKSFL